MMPRLRQEKRGKRAKPYPFKQNGILTAVIAGKHSVCTIFQATPVDINVRQQLSVWVTDMAREP